MTEEDVFTKEDIPTFDDLLGNLDDHQVELLSSHLRKIEYVNGEFVFHEGDDSNSLYVIQEGEVEISKMKGSDDQEYVPLVTLDEGNIVGELSFVRRSKRSANAIAISYAKLFELSRDDFNAIVDENPSLGCRIYDAILQVMAYRLERTDNHLIKLSQEDQLNI